MHSGCRLPKTDDKRSSQNWIVMDTKNLEKGPGLLTYVKPVVKA